MSNKGAPLDTDHEEKMALARQLQAERTPISTPKPRNRGRGHARGRSDVKATSFANPSSMTSRVNTTSSGTQSVVARGSQLTSRHGPSTPNITLGKENVRPAVRTGSGGGGLGTSRWASLPYSEYVAAQRTVPAAAPVTSRESHAHNDPMEVDEPTASIPEAAQPTPSPPTNAASVVPEPAAGSSVSKSRLAEPSLLDEDVPMVENMAEPIKPTRLQTMFGRKPGLSASRWAPSYTLDGREV